MPKRRLKGIVSSSKMDKTVVVKVERKREYPKYKTSYMIDRKYKAHSEIEDLKEGDKVLIEEFRPKSKGKRWKVVEKI
jgi:small subunit ribosomal protein S17